MMGEIVGPEYDRAWAAAGAAYSGKRAAVEELTPKLRALEKRIVQLETLTQRMARIIRRLEGNEKRK